MLTAYCSHHCPVTMSFIPLIMVHNLACLPSIIQWVQLNTVALTSISIGSLQVSTWLVQDHNPIKMSNKCSQTQSTSQLPSCVDTHVVWTLILIHSIPCLHSMIPRVQYTHIGNGLFLGWVIIMFPLPVYKGGFKLV